MFLIYSFLDKMYVLSSAAALEKFMKNPRPFLLPPRPQPPCKIIVHGPPLAGKTQLCYRLADAYDGQVCSYANITDFFNTVWHVGLVVVVPFLHVRVLL